MSYLSDIELQGMGFKSLGKSVKISRKASVYNPNLIEIGDFSRVDDFCVLSGRITIGRNVHIAPLSLIAGGERGIVFSDFSGCAYHVQVFTQSDDYSGKTLVGPTIPSHYKEEKKSPVFLGRQTVIGAGSIIFPGVEIAEGCSIGAMSLVIESTQPWGIYCGNPARRIKERKRDLLDLEKRYISGEGN